MEVGKRPIDSAYAEAIKPIRNHMRKFAHEAVLDALLRYLNAPVTERVEDLQRLPWVAERLVLWLLSDNPALYSKSSIKESSLRNIIQLAWDNFDKFTVKHNNIIHIHLWVRQMMLPQTPYQSGLNVYPFALQLYLIKPLASNHNLRKFLDAKAGMPIELYLQIGFVFWLYTSSQRPWFNGHFFQSLSTLFNPEHIKIFLCSVAHTPESVYKKLSKRTIEFDEWFQPLPLYKTPCIFHANTIIPFNRPTLRRFFDNLFGDWLEDNDKCRESYDDLISNYLNIRIKETNVRYLIETEIAKKLSTNNKVCDFLIDENEGYVLLEVKNKALTNKIPASAKPEPLRSRLKETILKGQKQLDETLTACKTHQNYIGRKCYLIIITKSELFLGSSKSISLESDETTIWFLSLEDFDSLVELVKKNVITFVSFFNDLTELQKDSSTSVFTVGMFLNSSKFKLNSLPNHLKEVSDEQFSSLRDKISQTD